MLENVQVRAQIVPSPLQPGDPSPAVCETPPERQAWCFGRRCWCCFCLDRRSQRLRLLSGRLVAAHRAPGARWAPSENPGSQQLDSCYHDWELWDSESDWSDPVE